MLSDAQMRQKLESRSIQVGNCLIWQGANHERGYGRVRWRNRICGTHRVMFHVSGKGQVPDEALVLHTCDQPACINPDHLYLGTHRDNARDCSERNRKARRDPESIEQAAAWISRSQTIADRALGRIQNLNQWIESQNDARTVQSAGVTSPR